MSRKSREKGKRVEREVAHIFGTNRNPADGHTHTDIHTDKYAIEVKARKSLPEWIHGAMQQAIEDSRDRIPLVVLVQSKVGALPIRYVLMRLEDFVKEESNVE